MSGLPAGWVRVDCHLHTVASGDSVLGLDEVAERAVAEGIDVVFVTDHHEIHAAQQLRRQNAANRDLGVRIEVGEEIRTPDGELLGLFLTERIPYVLPAAVVVERIRAQGGLVGLPHPFDPLRAGMAARAARTAEDLCASGHIAFVEAFNAKVGDPAHNAAAAAMAARHHLPGTAGSDAHDASGVGAAWVEMPDFDGPAAFTAALGQARIVGRLRPHARRYRPPPSLDIDRAVHHDRNPF